MSRKSLGAAGYGSTNEQLDISDWYCWASFFFFSFYQYAKQLHFISTSLCPFCYLATLCLPSLLSSVSYQNKYEMLLIHFPFALIFPVALWLCGRLEWWNSESKREEEKKGMYLSTYFHTLLLTCALSLFLIKYGQSHYDLSFPTSKRSSIYRLIYCHLSL